MSHHQIKIMLLWIRKPSALMGVIAVFSRLIVLLVGGYLVDVTGAIVMLVCTGVLVCANVSVTWLSLLSPSIGSSLISFHKLVWCLCLLFLHRNLKLQSDTVITQTVA